MTLRMRFLPALAVLLLVAPLALAAPAPVGTAAPAATVAPLCPAADFLASLATPQSDLIQGCGPCSDTACVGMPINSVCGVGFRCIATGLCSSAATVRRCQCLIIG
jgi:hypothetical protein